MPVTREEIAAAVQILKAVAETLRDLRSVPNGHFYANLSGIIPGLTLNSYNSMLDKMKECGLVKESGHVLTWVGPQAVPKPFQTA